ncbi:MAG: GAF domain-containing protein [Chloroflexi bacterium]|nr:GAF domain-containing protein [Chloroflexota bacterium]
MKKHFFRLPESMSPQARSAFLIAAAIATAHFVAVAYYLYLGQTTGSAQFRALAAISFALGVIIGFGTALSRRGQPTQGIILVLGAMAISYPPVSATLVGGLGLVLGLALMAIGPMSAFQILPRRSAWVMAVLTFISGLATLLLDIFGSTARPSLPGIVIQILAASVVGLLGFFIVRNTREIVAASLRLKITVWAGAILITLSIVLVIYSSITLRQTAIEDAQAAALAVTKTHASNVKSQLDYGLNAARTMAYSLGAVKDPTHPTPLTRDQANGMLRKVAQENPTFLGTWTIWEPNAFDGQDAQYANTSLHDETGRYIPYWVRVNNEIEGVAIIDYETPGIGDFYLIPRQTKQETIVTPYFYPIDGVDVLMTSLVVPIVENDQFYGVAGVDYRMDFVQGIVDEIDLYDGTATAILVSETGILIAVHDQPDLALQSASSILTDFEHIQQRVASDETFISLSSDGNYLRAFSPINIGEAGAHWSFSLIVPVSEITKQATRATVQEVAISIGFIILSILALWIFTGQITRPIRDLTNTANTISQGNLNAVANVQAVDETGVLAKAFNSMTAQLREFLATLESRVAERTRNIELAAEIGRTVSQVRALDVMLKDAAELIRSQFDLYYVQVYLTNPSQTALILQSGTGTVGAELIGRSHQLPLNGASINGRAATEKKSVVIADTSTSATFKPNPLLPDTRSEMAVPLLIGDNVVGVLDMQSRQAGTLSQEILPAFEALAGQLAVAIQNARLLEESKQARAEVEAQASRLARANWKDYLDAIHKAERIGYVYENNEILPLVEDEVQLPAEAKTLSSPISVSGEKLGSLIVELTAENQNGRNAELVNIVARQVAQQIESLRLLESAERYRLEAEETTRRATVEGWREYIEVRGEASLRYLYDRNAVSPAASTEGDVSEKSITLPLKAREETIGKIAILGVDEKDGDAAELAHAIAQRLGAHIENLRLFEETKRGQIELDKRARELESVAEISSVSARELDIQKMLETAVFLTQRRFGLYHAHVFTYDELSKRLKIIACGWKEGDVHEGTHGTTTIALEQEQSLVARAAREKRAVVVNDVQGDPGWLPNPLLPDTRSEMAVPLLVGDQILGVLDVHKDTINAFSAEDTAVISTLAAQVATALQNAHSFEQAQKQAERESALNVISQKIQSATTVEAVLQIAARELGHALGAPLTIAQLGVKNGND